MNKRFFLKLTITISFLCAFSFMFLKQSLAQFVPPPPPNLGQPSGNRQGGASRGDCPAITPDMTALVPISSTGQNPSIEFVGGLTSLEHPTFWFYTPYALNTDLPGEFVLLNDQQQYVYRTTLINIPLPGIIKVTIPEAIAGLEVGKSYHWSFLIYCSSDSPLFTQGTIQRISPATTLVHQLEQASPLIKAQLYANNGMWYEALSTIAELRLTNPHDPTIAEKWRKLLESVDLKNMVEQPIVSESAR